MAYAPLTHTTAAGTNGGTSAGIDTTGATLLVIVCSYFSAVTVSDSLANTWASLTVQTTGVSLQGKILYVLNPTVGAGHTFTVAETGGSPSICVASFSGAKLTSPFDQQNGASSGSSITSAGTSSITPVENSELIVAGVGGVNITSISIDSGMTITDQGGVRTSALAYKIQTSAAAISPVWSWTTASQAVAEIASFKAAASGAVLVRSFGLVSG